MRWLVDASLGETLGPIVARMRVDVTLLGRFEVHVDGVAVPERRWGGRRGPGVVKLLALGPGHRLHREQVIDALWPTLSLAAATPRLHKAVHLARAALGDHGALVTANERIELWPSADVVIDVDHFEALASTARMSCGPQELREAIDAYTGELLPDDVYESWTSAARERLRVQYGELLRLAERWEQLIALDPTDEVAHLHIVGRLVARRDRAGALRQLDHLTSALQRELDIEPSVAAQRLRDEVLALPIDASAPSAVVPHGAMPVPLTPLVGRMRELTELTAALDAQRLVTVTGPGGAGKTRLALAAIERWVAEHGTDVVFVDLARVTESTFVDAAVADAAAVPEQAGVDRLDTVVVALADRPTVLLVDNCEHVQNAARVCIERLLVRCPSIRILATSRMRLMLPSEHVVAVSGLSLTGPAGHSDASTLFAQRMVAAGADPPADEAQWALVDDICGQLDGLALAIELAAGRVPGFGLAGLARTLHDQLDVLAIGSRDAHRHRSLATAIGWSYDLLEAHEQAVLRAAAVFVTPFDLDGVCAVTGSPPPSSIRQILAHLVDWHLVTLLPDGSGRYRILETIRQHAATITASMGELEGLHAAHIAWCHAALDDLLARQPGGSRWRDDADGVFAETHAALSWATTDPGTAASVAVVAERFADALFQRGRLGEAQRRYVQAAEACGDATERSRLLRLAAGASAARNVGDDAAALLERSAAVATDAGHDDEAAEDLARVAALQRRAVGIMGHPFTGEQVDAVLARARSLSAGGLRAAAAIAIAEGWAPGSRAWSHAATAHALALAEEAGAALLVNEALDQLTSLEMAAGDLEAAIAAVDRRLVVLADVATDASSGFELYDALHMGCHVNLAAGRLDAARRHADTLAELPYLCEARHLGLGRRMEVNAMAGEFDAVVAHAALFEHDWRQAGRPVAGNLAVGAYAAAMVFGMQRDDGSRAHWTSITRSLLVRPERLDDPANLWAVVLDVLLALDDGDVRTALARTPQTPDEPIEDSNQVLWLPWYAAVWVEARVVAGVGVSAPQFDAARAAAAGNDIALTAIERAHRIAHEPNADLADLAERFTAAGCNYQANRTRSLALTVTAPLRPQPGGLRRSGNRDTGGW